MVIIGDSTVGKTSLLNRARWADREPDNTLSTIGVSFFAMNFQEENISFQIWDTAGQEKF